MLKALIEEAKPLADDAVQPTPLYWLVHEEGGTTECDYCRECALKVKQALIRGDVLELLEHNEQSYKYGDHPVHWAERYECTERTIWLEGGSYPMERDNLSFCELCFVPLDVDPSDYCIASELSHFSSLCASYLDGSMPFNGLGSDAWREIVQAMEGISYVEEPWFKGWKDPYREREAMEAYENALWAIPTLIALETGEARVWLLKDSRYQLLLAIALVLITLLVSLAS